MRVPFGERWMKRRAVPRPIDWLVVAERLLLGVLVLQCARLLWVLLTPVGSFGPYEGRQPQLISAAARQTLFTSFDPFFRSDAPQQASGGVVTSLALTLYGIRLNEGSGQGSAIIASPDGVQNSFAVGDEIMPGVVLKAVAFDHVLIDRGGIEEQLFLDQSGGADESAGAPEGGEEDRPGGAQATPPAAPVIGRDSPTADAIKRDVSFAPRLQNGRVTGLVLSGRGPAFAAAGFQPGDIVTQVNGQPVGSASDLQTLQNQLVPGARLSLTVERGAAASSVNLILQGQ